MVDELTTRMTDGERLWVWRKFRTGLSRPQLMEQLNFGRSRVSEMENDRYPVWIRLEDGAVVPLRIRMTAASLKLPERLALARRRSGLSLREVARLYGVSHVTLLKLERAGSVDLLNWWKSKKK